MRLPRLPLGAHVISGAYLGGGVVAAVALRSALIAIGSVIVYLALVYPPRFGQAIQAWQHARPHWTRLLLCAIMVGTIVGPVLYIAAALPRAPELLLVVGALCRALAAALILLIVLLPPRLEHPAVDSENGSNAAPPTVPGGRA